MPLKIVIIGGVAGGASAAAKARRVNEHAQIVMFEAGPYISFANCGLPYYIGGDIGQRDSLLLQTPESFHKRFHVDVHIQHEVIRIDREKKCVAVKSLITGESFFEHYDKLILAPGAKAIVPDLPGIKSENIFVLKTIPDSDALQDYLNRNKSRRAVIVGAGFIGLEMAEALHKRGLDVTIIERLPQILPFFDPEMAAFVSQSLSEQGVKILLQESVQSISKTDSISEIILESGQRVPFDVAILSIGVRPEISLAQRAGLKIGENGGIVVSETQQTSDPDIYAVGDAVETYHRIAKKHMRVPLAGPANRQGRVAGSHAAGTAMTFPGVLGSSIVESLNKVAAKTGLSEREARALGFQVLVSYTHSPDHGTYYPGSSLMHIKLIVEKETGLLLGGQIVGNRGVDKRIDVLATALYAGLKVNDLENLDLAYAPQFSSAKDPMNIAGFVVSNILRKSFHAITFEELLNLKKQNTSIQLVDVRTSKEFHQGHLDGSIHINVDDLRNRMHELDSTLKTVVYCRVGLRGYIAARILQQHGFKDVYNLSGGMLSSF